MAWLFIECLRPDGFRVGLLDGDRPAVRPYVGRSHALLAVVVRRFPRTVLGRIQGICVVQGPGSFTTVRTGVLAANLLSRLLKKPLVGISAEQAYDLVSLGEMLRDGKLPSSTTVLPIYNAEPNITLKTC
ncbi:MAG: hypothetical protein WA001_00495 [Patescibacteria group bacterium]